MTKTAKTIYYFGIYLVAVGSFLMLASSTWLEFIGLTETQSFWRTIVGFVVFALGYYYVQNARSNQTAFFRFTVHIRILQFVFFVIIWVAGIAPSVLVAFSSVELAAGIWTFSTIQKERTHGST
jgi:hypothetical protein